MSLASYYCSAGFHGSGQTNRVTYRKRKSETVDETKVETSLVGFDRVLRFPESRVEFGADLPGGFEMTDSRHRE